MILTKNLKKRYGSKLAVNNLNLNISDGQVYGFLGPNGAGKTTTMKMLTGILRPTKGNVKILGMNMNGNELNIKRRIGVVSDEPRMYSYFRGYEYMNFVMDIYGMNNAETKNRMEELCAAFGVDYLNDMISDLSHGMKQKVAVVSVLMRKPSVIFLDEPTVGLDARSAKILKELLEKYASEGATIFLTTHILEIAEKMCDRIGIIDEGTLIAEGTIDELRQKSGSDGNNSLEDIFLKLTGEGEGVEEIVKSL